MRYDFSTFRGDLFGGIICTIVALPVALAFGVASGMGAAAGLYGVIAVGFFASVFGGTKSQISGPTPSMTVAMSVIVTTHASSLSEAFTIAIMAGLMQIALGLFKIGRFVVYTPQVVVSGFMSGIGIVIILIQLLPFIGAPAPTGGGAGAVVSFVENLGSINYEALAVGAITLLLSIVWPKRLAKVVPSVLVALVVGSVAGALWFTNIPVIGEIPRGLPQIQLDVPSFGFLVAAFQPALILALLGSVDSLLTSLVADSLTGVPHKPNRELVGQGIGSVAAGLVGGLPGAGATMGTVTNIRAGGATAVAGVLRAVFVLLLLLGMSPLVEPIPHAVLAGILIKIGWDVIDWRLLTKITRLNPSHLAAILVTLVLTVLVDLVTAVAVGLIIAGMSHAQAMEGLELDSVVSVPLLDATFLASYPELIVEDDKYSARVGRVDLRGSFTVASSHQLSLVIGGDIKDHEVVIFNFSEAVFMDDSAAMLVANLVDMAHDNGTDVIMVGVHREVRQALDTFDVLEQVDRDSIVATLNEARDRAAQLLMRRQQAA